MGRLPVTSDFPENVKLAIVPPPANDPPTNILILLHGLGDKHESFTVLGGQMKLPETVCISIQGPQTLLGIDGYHWGDDLIFDSTTGGLDADAGFKQTTALLKLLIDDIILKKCGYRARDVMLFGFAQGGMAALSLAVEWSGKELGGIVSIGAGPSQQLPASLNPKCSTPILICAGSDRSSVTASSEEKLKHIFTFVQVKRYRRPGDHMPGNRDEMMPIMQFFSQRLKSQKGIPADSVEVDLG